MTVQQPQQQEARRQREPAPAPPTETRIPPPSRTSLQHVEVIIVVARPVVFDKASRELLLRTNIPTKFM